MSDKNDSEIVIKKKHLIILMLIFLLLLIGGILLGANWNKWFGSVDKTVAPIETTASVDENTSQQTIELYPNAGNWNGQTPQDKSNEEEVGIKIPGYPSITIAKDTENVVMALLNPEGNPCYFKFEIVLKDTDETIFESKYVAPGDAITDVTLTRPLAEGEYDATIMITTISLDGVTPLNGANVETVLIAK